MDDNEKAVRDEIQFKKDVKYYEEEPGEFDDFIVNNDPDNIFFSTNDPMLKAKSCMLSSLISSILIHYFSDTIRRNCQTL